MVGGLEASGVWFSCESAGREVSRTRGACLFLERLGFRQSVFAGKVADTADQVSQRKGGERETLWRRGDALEMVEVGELELSSEDMMLSRDDGKSYTGLLRFTISFDAQHKASVKTVGKTKTEVEE
jgi:hypothetical protein